MKLIWREQDKAFWGQLRHALGKKQGRSMSSVQVEQVTGEIAEYSSQAGVQEAIFLENHRKQFFLAEQAPIYKGWMRDAFGYLACSLTATVILNGTYKFPPDFDKSTKELCLACAWIRTIVPMDLVSSIIHHEEWSDRWKKAHEDMSSLESGLPKQRQHPLQSCISMH